MSQSLTAQTFARLLPPVFGEITSPENLLTVTDDYLRALGLADAQRAALDQLVKAAQAGDAAAAGELAEPLIAASLQQYQAHGIGPRILGFHPAEVPPECAPAAPGPGELSRFVDVLLRTHREIRKFAFGARFRWTLTWAVKRRLEQLRARHDARG